MPLHIHVLDANGNYIVHELSDKITGSLSLAVTAGQWFGAQIPTGYGYALVSCAVAPGFDFGEFEMASKSGLLKTYPKHAEIIEKLCWC